MRSKTRKRDCGILEILRFSARGPEQPAPPLKWALLGSGVGSATSSDASQPKLLWIWKLIGSLTTWIIESVCPAAWSALGWGLCLWGRQGWRALAGRHMAAVLYLPQIQVRAVLLVLPGRAAVGAVYHGDSRKWYSRVRANYEDAGKLFWHLMSHCSSALKMLCICLSFAKRHQYECVWFCKGCFLCRHSSSFGLHDYESWVSAPVLLSLSAFITIAWEALGGGNRAPV